MSVAYKTDPRFTSVTLITAEEVTQIDKAIMAARGYFSTQYHAGTREMVWRYVMKQMGDVNHRTISVALRVMRDNGEIIWDKHVWWRLNIK